jgi:cation diffusion facilitator CzcD-associated flavoprotein CzcO
MAPAFQDRQAFSLAWRILYSVQPIDAEAIIVGAGFSGIGMAIQLKKCGVEPVLLLERAGDVGGIWRDNVYPGCACDIPSMLYSFSFERNDGWTRLFPRQEEIWNYLRACIDTYELRGALRLNHDMAEARYDDESATWTLRMTNGTTLTTRILILAMGALNRPVVPAFPGLERYTGERFHSSAWDSAADLRGKNVAVIGTGASAVQIVPEIAEDAKRLAVFQRSAAWIMPRSDRAVSHGEQWRRRHVPGYAWFQRRLIYWLLEIRGYGFVVNPAMLKAGESVALQNLEKHVADPKLREKLVPSYRMGCKRILLSDDYYPALTRENVDVVTSPIAEFRERSIVTADGAEYPADAVVFATGFDATEPIGETHIAGRSGAVLADEWKDGMAAYLGTSVANFPNMFMIVGPNTGLGHNSMIEMMEAQYRFVCGAVELLRSQKLRAIDVKPHEQAAFNAGLQERLAKTVWSSGCRSWYLDKSGKNTTLWPGFTYAFRKLTRRPTPEHFDLIQ